MMDTETPATPTTEPLPGTEQSVVYLHRSAEYERMQALLARNQQLTALLQEEEIPEN